MSLLPASVPRGGKRKRPGGLGGPPGRFAVLNEKTGNVLLSRTIGCSIIAAEALNRRVRDGNGCFSLAVVTGQKGCARGGWLRVRAARDCRRMPRLLGRRRRGRFRFCRARVRSALSDGVRAGCAGTVCPHALQCVSSSFRSLLFRASALSPVGGRPGGAGKEVVKPHGRLVQVG